jgi:hypothetical protein
MKGASPLPHARPPSWGSSPRSTIAYAGAADGEAASDLADGEELLRQDDASVPRKVHVEAVFDAP